MNILKSLIFCTGIIISGCSDTGQPKPIQVSCENILRGGVENNETNWINTVIQKYSEYSDEQLIDTILLWNDLIIKKPTSYKELREWKNLYERQEREIREFMITARNKADERQLYFKHLGEIFAFMSRIPRFSREFLIFCTGKNA